MTEQQQQRPGYLKELEGNREHLKGFEQGGDVIIFPFENITLAAECKLGCMRLKRRCGDQ